ncbi:MAG TPA: Maf family protein [Polyangia bacterium]|nr:Maf family protein [Polyangia bacterium]
MAQQEDPDLVLASASPRRRELLERLGLVLRIIPADADETVEPHERAVDYVRRVAMAKCDKVFEGLAPGAVTAEPVEPALAVLAADTTVVVDDTILGKPADGAEARAMLARLAGRRHEVITATSIRFGARRIERTVRTLVAMRALQPSEIAAYLACDEWRGKAGGYALQGIAAAFVSDLRGSVTNVIGLPLAEVLADLQALEALPRYPAPAFGMKRAD